MNRKPQLTLIGDLGVPSFHSYSSTDHPGSTGVDILSSQVMSTGTRRPSFSRFPSVSFSKQSSVSSHNSYDFLDDAASSDQTDGKQGGIWSTTRRKLTLVSLCLVYFAATASFAILSPFFPGEVIMSVLGFCYAVVVVLICYSMVSAKTQKN